MTAAGWTSDGAIVQVLEEKIASPASPVGLPSSDWPGQHMSSPAISSWLFFEGDCGGGTRPHSTMPSLARTQLHEKSLLAPIALQKAGDLCSP